LSRYSLKDIRGFIDGVYGHDLHVKRVASLADATLGVMTSALLAVAGDRSSTGPGARPGGEAPDQAD
jgi:hypothetical protein